MSVNLLDNWTGWLEVIRDEIRQLLTYQDIFWSVQEIVKKNKRIQKPSMFFQYLGDTYVTYAVIGIRRQVKRDRDSISFAKLLDAIAINPKQLSREYFKNLYKGFNAEILNADRTFDEFSGIGKDHICPKMVRSDFDKLMSTAKKVETFADKRVAHHDKQGPEIIPTFADADECIQLLDKLYVKYYKVFYAVGMKTLLPTYQYNWKEIFTVPWIKSLR